MVFGTATGDTVPFALTLDGTVLTGTATIGSPLNCPAAAAEQPAGTVVAFPVTITGPGDQVWYSTRTGTSVTEQTSHLMEMSSCSEKG